MTSAGQPSSPPSPRTVLIQDLHSLTDMLPIVELQRQIWGYGRTDTEFPYPARALLAISESGGHVAGAFVEGAMVGFSLAWLGMSEASRELYLHSQLMGVLQDYRHLKIGYQLKTDQRNFARNRDLSLVKWTFDPLRSANANLNIRKLGVVIRSYQPDYYGRMESDFNRGLDSDRIWAEWYVSSNRVRHRLTEVPPLLNREPELVKLTRVSTQGDEDVPARLTGYELDRQEQQLLVEVPDDFQVLVDNYPSIAREWQTKIREIFQHYLSRGYTVSDFLVLSGQRRRSFYLVTRDSLQHILESEE